MGGLSSYLSAPPIIKYCIRCVKKAKALKKIGYEVHGMGNRPSYGAEIYDTYQVWHSEKQFKEGIKLYINSGVRGITWDNEPHIQAKWIKEVISDMGAEDTVKLLVDCHDLEIIRQRAGHIDELEMFNSADGVIYVSNPIQERVNKLYRVDKPNTVIYSYCNEGLVDVDYSLMDKRKGIVYEGGANPPEDTQLNQIYAYRSLYNIIKRLVELGNETHMFCGNSDAYTSYHSTGAVLHPPTEYNEMMKQLCQYKWGILIFNNEDGKKDQVNLTLTNKFHEYSHAGIPSPACWCAESMKLVKKWGVGVTFDHIDNIGDCSQLQEVYPELIENIKVFKEKAVMENFIWKIENLYAEVLGLKKKKVSKAVKDLSVFEYGKAETIKLLK